MADPILPPDSPVPHWTCGTAVGRWLDALRHWRADVLYVHGLRSPALEREVLAVAPAAFFPHSYLGTCISGSRLHRFPSDVICTREFGAGCLAYYFPRRCGGSSPLTMIRQYHRQRTRRELLAQYRYILVHAAHMAGVYERHGFGNVRIVGYPVPPARGERTCAAGPPWKLLYLGRLEPTKGTDLAATSAALAANELRLPVHLQISGAGTQADWLKGDAERAMARSRYLSVTITGWLDRDEANRALSEADLLLVPSRWPEPFGLVGLEAATYGVPSVAFDAGGIRDWLVDGETGRLVAGPPTAAALATGIVDCLADPARLADMRTAAIAMARRFTMTSHLASLEAVFGEMVGSNAPRAIAR